MEQTPKPYPFNLNRLEKLRAVLAEEVCFDYYQSVLVGPLLQQFMRDVKERVAKDAHQGALLHTLRNLAGRTLTATLIAELAWRLVGNLHRLAAGVPAMPWTMQHDPEWVPVQVEEAEPRSHSFKAASPEDFAKADRTGRVHKDGLLVKLRILAGQPAGLVMKRFWSKEMCFGQLREVMGYSKFKRETNTRIVRKRTTWDLQHLTEFFNLRLWVLIEAAHCQHAQPGFKEVRSTSTTIQYNREVMKKRLREDFKCPAGLGPGGLACFKCPWGADRCAAACHPRGWLHQECQKCKKLVFVDSGDEDGFCLSCRARS